MRLSRWFGLVTFSSLALACERAKAPAGDSAAASSTHADSAAIARASNWNSSIGPVLLIAGDTPDSALIIVPDSSQAATTLANIPRPADVTLFSRNGAVQTAELPDPSDDELCPAQTLTGAPPPHAWKVGFVGGVVAPIAMDSAAAIPAPDSTALGVWMNRLASALPNDSAGRFRGLPFVLRGLWRLTIPNGPAIAVATLTRQINQEATPLQENTVLVAERSADGSYDLKYSERTYGDEETIESTDVLASALIGSSRTPTLFLARDYGDATGYSVIERADDGQWRLRWTSAHREC